MHDRRALAPLFVGGGLVAGDERVVVQEAAHLTAERPRPFAVDDADPRQAGACGVVQVGSLNLLG